MFINRLKTIVRKIPGIPPIIFRVKESWAYFIWTLRGKPPGDVYSFYKRHRLIHEGKRHGCSTLVETGTFLGGTVRAARPHFQRILSVELSPQLHLQVLKRFGNAQNVKLWQGDSGKIMPEMLRHIIGRAIFWLDGHYSGGITARGDNDCPIVHELEAIGRLEQKDNVILIDDARCYGQLSGYPSQEEVRRLLFSINRDYQVTVEDDCIIARPISLTNTMLDKSSTCET